jgi:hypothetical protein
MKDWKRIIFQPFSNTFHQRHFDLSGNPIGGQHMEASCWRALLAGKQYHY